MRTSLVSSDVVDSLVLECVQLGLASALTFGVPSAPALASEFDILSANPDASTYIVDDARVINRATFKQLSKKLKDVEEKTGYRVQVATIRKLVFDPDAFSFADKVIEKWYPSVEEGNKKGLLLVVTAAKEGAVTGGPNFMKTVGDDVIDSIISDNFPILLADEKNNEAVLSSVKRIEAVLEGLPDPGPPKTSNKSTDRTYKTKRETQANRTRTSTIVLTLLFISVVVPMIQFYSYTGRD